LIRKFFQHVLPGILRPLRVLWNEVIGFVFVVFAAVAGFRTLRELRQFDGDGESVFAVALTAFFALVMGFYGVSSFLRARKISKS
jgi:hypothetical protein